MDYIAAYLSDYAMKLYREGRFVTAYDVQEALAEYMVN